MNASVFFLALRRMRAPLIVLIVIYALSTLGLTLIPGIDAQGQPAPPMSFFHAFYFVSYTASTIGFGELPVAFSEAQRMWVSVVIFLSVIGWSYSIISLLVTGSGQGFSAGSADGGFRAPRQAARRAFLHPLWLRRDRPADRARPRP
jgi:voltage-gated potassium channel